MTLILSGTSGLSDVDGSAATPAIRGTDANTGIFFPAADTIAFSEGGAEAMRIDSSGNVGIGTSSPYAKVQAYQSSSTLPVNWIYRGPQGNSAIPTTFGYPYLQIGAAEYNSAGTAIQTIGFGYISANGNFPPAEIGIATTSVSGETYGALVFATRSVFTNTAATERMRIDASGSLLVGTTAVNFTGSGLTLSSNAGTTKWLVGPYTGVGTNFYICSSGSTGVYLNGTSATSWSSNSDERLKTDLLPIENAATKVASLRAVTGRYKTDSEGTSRAFLIAQDVQAVLPEAVSSSKIAGSTDETEYLGVAYTEVIPLLVAAIKEQQTIITQLQADVAALKAQP